MIQMKEVSKTYSNGAQALKDVSVHVAKSEFVYVIGPSGAGKSTFIKLMYCEEQADKGQIFINQKDVTRLRSLQKSRVRRSLGVVFQDFKLLPKLTAFGNVAFAMEVIERPRKEIKKRVMDVLDLVQLKHKARAFPHELSGGEQQRIAIARALVNSPGLLIADEPTGNLDPETSWEIMHLFNEINNRGTTVIMATHNKEIVNSIRKRVIAMEDGQIVRDEDKGEYGYED